MDIPGSVDDTLALLDEGDYLAGRGLATSVFLALHLRRPLFLEGEAGVGKTEVAKVLAKVLGRRLVRLQCYEGLDVAAAVYEWNYARQMLEIRIADATRSANLETLRENIYSPEFLIERPLLQSLDSQGSRPAVLLIDELDRADEPFEAYLLEVLSDYQITIPELGTIKAGQPPIVVITSNRTREIHDALRRRCFYHWVDYPDARREFQILRRKAPGSEAALSNQVVAFVQVLRQRDLFKLPGVAETIDWLQALTHLQVLELDVEVIGETLGTLLKYQDDIVQLGNSEVAAILDEIRAEAADDPIGQ